MRRHRSKIAAQTPISVLFEKLLVKMRKKYQNVLKLQYSNHRRHIDALKDSQNEVTAFMLCHMDVELMDADREILEMSEFPTASVKHNNGSKSKKMKTPSSDEEGGQQNPNEESEGNSVSDEELVTYLEENVVR